MAEPEQPPAFDPALGFNVTGGMPADTLRYDQTKGWWADSGDERSEALRVQALEDRLRAEREANPRVFVPPDAGPPADNLPW